MTKIDWSDETINPLGHGCYGTGTKDNPKICEYCYAVKMAKRNMRNCDLCAKFIPHTHFEQLDKLKQWKKPKTIFVQSMGDLFGDWVPDEWIEKVFDACLESPQHRYLFLTKNPKRYIKILSKYQTPHDFDRFVDFVIIGRETGNRKDKIIPKKEWIENIVNYCKEKNVPVFMKNNLKDIWQEPLIQEFPWRDK